MKTDSKKVKEIFSEVLQEIKPSPRELHEISMSLKEFLGKIEKSRINLGIEAQIFVGGSFAKHTLVKKEDYDIDIFIRFDKKYPDKNLSDLTEKILRNFKAERIHGSRDYFKIRTSNNVFFEIVPVRKVSSAKDAMNITDLSYYHVKYINKKIKSGKTLDDIMLSKAFCDSCNCYGAESYIQGFSGYGLELLVYHYKSFIGFIKAMAASKEGKIVIDIEKHHKKKSNILLDLNSAKLESPIVLIDPTHKQRNVLAALSPETFSKFREQCKGFLRSPSIKFFKKTHAEPSEWKKEAGKGYEFLEIGAKTDRQAGDIAGSKLLKFYKLLEHDINRFFQIKKSQFEYSNGKIGKFFFIVKPRGEILVSGPHLKDKKNSKRFKAKHKKAFVKKGQLYAKVKTEKSLNKFISDWKKKNFKIMKDMSIVELKND